MGIEGGGLEVEVGGVAEAKEVFVRVEGRIRARRRASTMGRRGREEEEGMGRFMVLCRDVGEEGLPFGLEVGVKGEQKWHSRIRLQSKDYVMVLGYDNYL